MKLQILILSVAIAISSVGQLFAQDDTEYSQTEKKGFVIVAAGKNYNAIIKQAQSVSEKLNYKLDLRDLIQNDSIGLSFPKDSCEEHGFEYPAYIPRGRWDDGKYVSVEYTDAYTGFTPGYYIIVAASYSKDNAELKKALNFVKPYYKTAYIKYADVYMGCLH